ncbi:MAG: phenylacetaldoxime dehydratase family protein [Gammaproteobacteria bacterium]|nr:phenylacetaldoxime dehydratase family protein [Gammaproteobacteria bacterium]
MSKNEGQAWDVPMWHEVFVVRAGAGHAEYINCHNRTGFLTLAMDPQHQGVSAARREGPAG